MSSIQSFVRTKPKQSHQKGVVVLSIKDSNLDADDGKLLRKDDRYEKVLRNAQNIVQP